MAENQPGGGDADFEEALANLRANLPYRPGRHFVTEVLGRLARAVGQSARNPEGKEVPRGRDPERTTVVGVFKSRDQAQRAITALRQAGFREEQIGFVVRGGMAAGVLQDLL